MPTWGAWPDDIVTDEVVTAAWLTSVSQSLAYLEDVGYQEFVANVAVTATTEAGAATVVSLPPITFEAVPHMIEFFAPRIVSGVAALRVALFEGATSLGLIASLDASGDAYAAVHRRKLTPTAGSHTYSIRAWNASAATSNFGAGAGGTGVTLLPGYIRAFRIPV